MNWNKGFTAGIGHMLLAAGLVLGLSMARPAQAAPVREIVLVHGAFMDGSSWAPVIERLQARGFSVRAAQNPLRSLRDDAQVVRDLLAQPTGTPTQADTLLVGFSWGGVVIGELADEARVAGLVYVAAPAPDVGQSLADLQAGAPAGPAMPGLAALKQNARGQLLLDPARWGEAMAHELPPERAALLAAVQTPVPPSLFSDKASAAAWRTRRSWYVVATEDRLFAPALQWQIARRIGAEILALPSSHAVILSQPERVAALIEQAAKALGEAK